MYKIVIAILLFCPLFAFGQTAAINGGIVVPIVASPATTATPGVTQPDGITILVNGAGGTSVSPVTGLRLGHGAGSADTAGVAGSDYVTPSGLTSATSASALAATIVAQTGCSTAGYAWAPSSNTCVAQASGGAGVSLPIVTPETYGAMGDGATYYDGSMAVGSATLAGSGNFLSGSVGKPICVAGASATPVMTGVSNGGYQQLCGTITGFNSPTSIVLSFSNASGAALSNTTYAYGTSDQVAFNAMMTACASGGCNVQLAPKTYILTNTLTYPMDTATTITGAGPSWTGPGLLDGYKARKNGTQLAYLTKTMTGPAVLISGTALHTVAGAQAILKNLAIVCGAGYSYDGCGADGVDIFNWQDTLLENVWITNAAGIGELIDGINAASGYDYTETNVSRQVFINGIGGVGWQVGRGSGVYNLETPVFENGIIQGTGGPAVWLNGTGSSIQGLRFTGNVVQYANALAPNPLIKITGTPDGCTIADNYLENDGAPWQTNTLASVGSHCQFQSNHRSGPAATVAEPSMGNAFSDPTHYTCIGCDVATLELTLGTNAQYQGEAILSATGTAIATIEGQSATNDGGELGLLYGNSTKSLLSAYPGHINYLNNGGGFCIGAATATGKNCTLGMLDLVSQTQYADIALNNGTNNVINLSCVSSGCDGGQLALSTGGSVQALINGANNGLSYLPALCIGGSAASTTGCQANQFTFLNTTQYRGISQNNGTNAVWLLYARNSGGDNGVLSLLFAGIPTLQLTANGAVNYFNTGQNTCFGATTCTHLLEVNGAAQAAEFYQPITTLTASAAPGSATTNGMQTITLNANATLAIGGVVIGQRVTYQICQPATGGPYTWAWPSVIHGGMVIGTTANTCSMQSFISFTGTTLVAENNGVINVAP